MLFPFVWMISTALRPEGHQAELSLIPQPYLAFENFARAWTYPHTLFNQYAINSLVIAIVSTVLAVSLNALAGFAFAKYKFPGRTVLFYLVLATLMVPFQITMIPTYVTVAKLGLINNYWGVILPGTASAFGIFLVRQFMQSIPDELLDAARIDGSSEFGIFVRIIVPLSGTVAGRPGHPDVPVPLERLSAAAAGPEPSADVHAARSASPTSSASIRPSGVW